ncbi:MAG: C10 family peptidase, partial [bacterium]|nr:C10 family peptidase [bacterium]
DGSGAYSEDVPGALRNYFAYNTSAVRNRASYNNAQWYALLETNMVQQRPVYYSFYSTAGGHAIVCDGTRNGNEIHLNYGWGGYATAWYNMDNVNGGGSTWTGHRAVMDIAPKFAAITVHEVVVEEDDDHDTHVAPGETAGLRIWLRNTGGASAGAVTGMLASLDPNLTVLAGGPVPYGVLTSGALASNEPLYHVLISGACPAGDYPLQFVASANDSWTNMFMLRVERLPRIVCVTTNVLLTAEHGPDDSVAIVLSNAGIETLTVYLTDNVLGGSTNYSVRTSDQADGPLFVWQDLAAQGITVPFSDDDGVSQMLDIGFDFPFFGQSYSQVMIGANGGIGLTNGILYYQNRALPTTKMYAPARFLAPLWCDLEPSKGGAVRYFAGAGQFIVAWDAVPLYNTTTTETFQAILRPNGEIIYQYKQHSGVPTNTIGVQAGVSPAGPAVPMAYNQPFVHDGLAVRIAPARGDSWLNYAPGSASIPPGSATSILVQCSAAYLSNGVYSARATVIHNDPRVPPLPVAVEFIVPEPALLAGLLVLVGLRLRRG